MMRLKENLYQKKHQKVKMIKKHQAHQAAVRRSVQINLDQVWKISFFILFNAIQLTVHSEIKSKKIRIKVFFSRWRRCSSMREAVSYTRTSTIPMECSLGEKGVKMRTLSVKQDKKSRYSCEGNIYKCW